MRTTTDILKRAGRTVQKWASSRSLLTFCLFLIFAAILWYGHALNSVRDRVLHIPIEWQNVSDNIAFETPLPQQFTITVRDQGKRLRRYNDSAFQPVQIDLLKQLTASKGTVQVSAEQVRQKITDQLQGTAKLQSLTPEHISSAYYRQASKQVGIKLNAQITSAAQYQFTLEPQITPQRITIYGRQEQLDTITALKTDYIQRKDVKDSLHVALPIQPIEGIRYKQDTVTLLAYAEQFTEKRITLPITTVGVPRGERLRTFPATVEVTARVSVGHFTEVDSTTIKAVCRYPKTEQKTLPIEVQTTSSHILQTRSNPANVEYIIEH